MDLALSITILLFMWCGFFAVNRFDSAFGWIKPGEIVPPPFENAQKYGQQYANKVIKAMVALLVGMTAIYALFNGFSAAFGFLGLGLAGVIIVGGVASEIAAKEALCRIWACKYDALDKEYGYLTRQVGKLESENAALKKRNSKVAPPQKAIN